MRLQRCFNHPLDLGGDPMRLGKGNAFGEYQVKLDPMRIADMAVTQVVIGQTPLLGLPIQYRDELLLRLRIGPIHQAPKS